MNKPVWNFNFTREGRPATLGERLEVKRRPLQPIKPLKVAAVTPLMVPLVELRFDQCHYPVNDSGPFLFCGHKKKEGKTPYCELHHRLCYRPPDEDR